MHFSQQTKKIISIFSTILYLSFSAGFITGVAFSLRHMLESQYAKYNMVRLIAINFQRNINYWTIYLVAFGLVLFLILVVIKIKWGKVANIGKIRFIKRVSMLLFIIAALLNCSVFVDSRVNAPKGPNVLFIVTDTLRADHLSSYGYNRNTSPNIDKLSSHSILFKNAISPAPWTTPSLSSVITSQYPAVLGFTDEPVKIDNGFLTLAEIFKDSNYKTKGIISHTFLSSALGFDQGFDSYDEENAKGHGHISSPSLVKKAMSFLEKNKNNKFFLFIHMFDPHYDYILHEKYNYYRNYNGVLYSSQPYHELRYLAPSMEERDINFMKALYDSEINFTDEHIGKLLDRLKELGLFDNTLIVFTADHGEEFLERGDYWIGHTKKLYQEQIHVPLIIKLPGNNEGKIIEGYYGLIDLMPMIIDFAGLKIPGKYEYEGKNIDLSSGDISNNRPIISETKRLAKLQSVTWKDWKFIYNLKTGMKELYNLKDDPLESKNVASTNRKTSDEMETILSDWDIYAKSKRSGAETQQPKFTKEQIERLKSLGYIE